MEENIFGGAQVLYYFSYKLQNKTLNIIQRVYEIFCFICFVAMLDYVKDDILYRLPLFILPFILGSFIKNELTKRISFAIFLTIISYGAWTFTITLWLTKFLDWILKFDEHSLWDLFAIIIPIIMAILTFFLTLKTRKTNDKYDRLYLTLLLLTLTMIAICS